MGCQTAIAEKIIESGADYVLALKGNQAGLFESVKEHFAKAAEDSAGMERLSTSDTGHGRIEQRFYTLSTDIEWLLQKEDWAGIKSVGKVRSVVEKKGIVSEEERYYISSLSSIDIFSKSVRKHWGIENGLHWCLDISFNEDKSRTRKDNSAENLAVARHIAVNILKKYPKGMSIKRKRSKCCYDPDFLEQVINYTYGEFI